MSKGTYLYLIMCLDGTSGTRQHPHFQVPSAANDKDARKQGGKDKRQNALYLAAHSEEEENEEVHDEDWPVDGHVKHFKEGREDRDDSCARR